MSPERRSEASTPRRDATQPRQERRQIWRVFEYRRPVAARPRFTT